MFMTGLSVCPSCHQKRSQILSGQSAAEVFAPVQKVDDAKLRERLLADKQVLEWK
jgi:hypothetical protein